MVPIYGVPIPRNRTVVARLTYSNPIRINPRRLNPIRIDPRRLNPIRPIQDTPWFIPTLVWSHFVLNAAKSECSSVESLADFCRSPCILPAAEKTRLVSWKFDGLLPGQYLAANNRPKNTTRYLPGSFKTVLCGGQIPIRQF